jgi:hypothetical protein
MSNDKKPQSLADTGLDSTLLPNIDIDPSEGNYSEALKTAVLRSKPKRKVSGLPYGVHTKEAIEEKAEKDSKAKASTVLRDKRLTAKMRAFATYVALGDSPREAVVKAYDCSKSSQASIMVLANRMMRDVRINVLIESLTDITKEAILKEEMKTRKHVLDELYDHANDKEAPLSLRIRSLELLGKSVGMFTDRVETNKVEHDIEQLKDDLKKSLALMDATDQIRERFNH